MKRTKVSIIGCVGIPANYGGFETFAERLAKELSSEFDFTVYCSTKAYPERKKDCAGAHLRYIPLKANGIQSILYDVISIFDALFQHTDVLLILGVSGCLILPILRFFGCKKRILANIDGLEWKRAKWSPLVRKFLKYSESCAVRASDCVIGDNQVIVDYIAEEYKTPGTLIEYGADHVQKNTASEDLKRKYTFTRSAYCFGVCRIEPENNVEMILEAFQGRSEILVFVGNWRNSEYGIHLYEAFSKSPNIHLLQPIYDEMEINYLRGNCSLYLHGHSCGGTNPSLIEAMALGAAILAYDVNFNRETTENKALYFHSSDDLKKILDTKSANYPVIRQAMAEIAARRYTWKRIAGLYQNCCEGKQ